MAEHQRPEAERRHDNEGGQGGSQGERPVRTAERIDQPARVEGQEDVSQGRERDGGDERRHEVDATAPPPNHEGKHAAESIRAVGL